MKNNLSLTARLGITQQQLADYLGVSRATLGMYDSGLRPLPGTAATKINQLEVLLLQQQKKKAAKPGADKKQAAKMASHLQEHIHEHTKKARSLQKKLNAAKKLYAKHTSLLQLTTAMLGRQNITEADKAWATAMAGQAQQTVNNYGEHVQATLQLQLNALNQQLKEAAAALKAIKI